jgi:hypothetical protein
MPTKYKLCIFLSLWLCLHDCSAQQIVYVWAKDGLRMRDESSKNGKVVCALPYGTALSIKSKHNADSVVMIPSIKRKNGKYSKPYYIKGNWVFVETDCGSGFIFDGYLSSLQPFILPKGENPSVDLEDWANQQSSVKSSRFMDGKYYQGHEYKYENGMVHFEDGSSEQRLTLPEGYSLNDGILLLNYFDNIHIPYPKLIKRNGIEYPDNIFELQFDLSKISFKGPFSDCETECWFAVKVVMGKIVIVIGSSC